MKVGAAPAAGPPLGCLGRCVWLTVLLACCLYCLCCLLAGWQTQPYVSCCALVAALSVLLRRPVPSDVMVLAECRLDGSLEPPRGPVPFADQAVLSLAR